MVTPMKITNICPEREVMLRDGTKKRAMDVWVNCQNEHEEYVQNDTTFITLWDDRIDQFNANGWKLDDYVLVEVRWGYERKTTREGREYYVTNVRFKIIEPQQNE